jgi:sporulation protein YlmC with PRC-barrel domain
MALRVLSASTLIGDRVVNLQGQQLGKLEELMLDLDSGQVAYAVLSFGGVLGMGEKLFAIPWGVLTVDTREKQLILDVDRNVLENAPGFDKDHWPETGSEDWQASIYQYYGYKPYWKE